MRRRRILCAGVACLLSAGAPSGASPKNDDVRLTEQLVVTFYGNPRTPRMGVLGESSGAERAAALRTLAQVYTALTSKRVVMAYHVVAVIAQPEPGVDGRYRRRETSALVRALLDEARLNGFRLILDIQPGRSTVAEEVRVLEPFLSEPDVDLALDPEFAMPDGVIPGQRIGTMQAADVNGAIDALETLIRQRRLPRKMLIVHQFTQNMLPDKSAIRTSTAVDVVLDMDGFGPPSLKRSTWRFVQKQPLAFAGVKLFYKQDSDLLRPAEVLALTPTPSVVVYQ